MNFNDFDVIIDSDGLPWLRRGGFWTSTWSIENAIDMAESLLYTDDGMSPSPSLVTLWANRIKKQGLTTQELVAIYPNLTWRAVTETMKISLVPETKTETNTIAPSHFVSPGVG